MRLRRLFHCHVNHLDSFLMLFDRASASSSGLRSRLLSILILVVARPSSSLVPSFRWPPLLHTRCHTGILRCCLGQGVSVCAIPHASTASVGNGGFAFCALCWTWTGVFLGFNVL